MKSRPSDNKNSNHSNRDAVEDSVVYRERAVLEIVLSSEKGAGIGSRVLLVSVSVSQPDTENLCKTEEETNSAHNSQHLFGVLLDYRATRRLTVMSLKTHSPTGFTFIEAVKSAAVEVFLDVRPGVLCVVPTHLQELILLFFV